MIEWSNDKDNIVNVKIREIWAAKTWDECQKLCRELFEMAHYDGQQYVWAVRNGNFTGHKITPEGRELAKKLGQTEEEFLGIDLNKFEKTGDGEWTLKEQADQLEQKFVTLGTTNFPNGKQQYVEFKDGKFRLREMTDDQNNTTT